MELLAKILVCFLAGAGAGIGTGFAGMSAAAVIGPMLMTFLGVPAYQAVGIGLASDVLASATSAWTYKKHKNLDVKNSLPLLIGVLVMTLVGSFVASLLPERAMSGTMQIAMIFIGLRFLLKPVKTTKEQMAAATPKERLIKSIVGGVLVGFICGFVGAGGGMMLLFVLTSFLGYEMRRHRKPRQCRHPEPRRRHSHDPHRHRDLACELCVLINNLLHKNETSEAHFGTSGVSSV